MTKTTFIRFLNALNKNKEDYKIEYRKKLTFPLYLHQVLIGLLLSDGSLEKSSDTSTPRLNVIFSNLHISYLMHLYNLFEPYTDSDISIYEVKNKKVNNDYTQVRFKTVSLPSLLYYYNIFYQYDDNKKNNIKIVPSNIIDLMSPVVLAHLIMGDGNLKLPDKIIRIYTNSFTKKEVELLAKAIYIKLDIKTKVVLDRNNQYIMTINRSQLDKIKNILLPHMHISMLYKLGINYNDLQIPYFNLKLYLGEM